MRRHIQRLAGLAILAMAAPAPAQNVRDHRRPRGPILSVSDFQPRSGPVGTLVTVTGAGFTPRTRVLMGGRPARVTRVRPRSLQFRVPVGARHGHILLRHPGIARDIRVGKFGLAVNLSVTQVAPNAGAPGTRVEILGRGFRPGDQVRISGQALKVLAIGPQRIVAAIPRGARPGPVVVLRPGTNQRARGPMFNVLQPPPRIVSMTPSVGTPGTRVRVNVQALAPTAQVRYGRRPVQILARGPGWLDVQIPARARRGRYLVVSGPNGTTRSPTRFGLQLAPVIQRLSPAYGLPGTRVEIHGSNFRPGDIVTMDGVRLRIDLLRGNRISVRIPRRVRTAPIVVERGNLRGTSPMPFERLRRPRIRDIQPRFGQPGTLVAIRGRALTSHTQVMYGAQAVPVERRKGNRVVWIRVPARARDQFIHVTTRAGSVRSPVQFAVHRYPVVRGIAPARGLPGTQIVLRGRKLRNATAVYLGNTKLSVIRRMRGRMVVVVPETAQSGRIDVESYGRRQPTPYSFTVIQYPAISGFSPKVGYPGALVTISGIHFTNNTEVSLGKTPLTIVQRNLPSSLTVRIPPRARARAGNFFWIKDGQATARSQLLFKVIAPAALTGFTPKRAKPGAHLTLTGVDMNRVASVLVGSTQAHVVRRVGSTKIVIEVPPSLRTGAYHLWLRERTGTQRSRAKLRVLPAARGTAVLPPAAPRGVTVRIRGKHFDQDTKASFRGVNLPVLRVGRWGRVMWVQIPQGVRGSGSIIIDDGGATSRVPGTFRILERPGNAPPPPPPGKVRRH